MSEESPQRPAWQTEELQEEWVEEDPSDDDANNLTYGTRSISLTLPLPSQIHTNSDLDLDVDNSNSHTSFRAVGTFLVREDIPNVPVLAKTPGRARTGIIKDFFSPLPLERMFEPPTPPKATMSVPPVPAGEPGSPSDEIMETDLPNMVSFHGRKASIACQFTFAAPKGLALDPNAVKPSYPQAQSTPTPHFAPNAAAPATDPRLRLFQFQYDTFTREHLSALADSIAVASPSGTGTRSGGRLSTVSEASFSDLRSTKRVKLSPPSDYGEGAGAGASIARPKIYGNAYVRESQSLMEKIKQARDFSTISTVASADGNDGNASKNDKSSAYEQLRRSSLLNVPSKTDSNPSSSSGTMNSNSPAPYSSSTYRQQAAALMAQIKSDMKGNKRIFSGDSEMSHVTAHLDDEMSFAHVLPPTIVVHSHDKENQRDNSRHHRRVSSTSSARTRASPRRQQQRPLEPTEGDLAGELSKLSLWRRPHSSLVPQGNVAIIANPALLGPVSAAPTPAPAHPTTSIRAGTNDDLNRFVSSSTASGTTLTAGSVPAYVKHPGPAQLRTIAPKDLPTLPDRMGDMLFDKVMMKWVKSVQPGGPDVIPEEEVSEDPFGDIESLRDDSRGGRRAESGRGDATEDEEEMELTSFSTDASGRVVAVMTGVDTNELDEETTDSEGGNDAVVTGELEHTVPTRRDSESESEREEEEEDVGNETEVPHHLQADLESLTDAFAPPPIVVTTFTTPPPSVKKTPASALKTRTSSVTPKYRGGTPTSALKSISATPSSALKDTRFRTPRQGHGHRRSVSFSDGKRDGPIRGLGSVEPSARSKRIAEMLARSDSSEMDSDSPTKGSGARAGGSGSSMVSTAPSASMSGNASASSSRQQRVFARSHASRSVGHNNGTFLTECSFGVAHDRLVEVLTDVEPFEPHWETLSTVDLSERRLESAARLKEFLPALDALNLNANQLSWLSGIPGGVRTLSVASNRLTGLTSYSHLLNLENLDISRNEVDSLRQLACLRHLRELRADGNTIASVEGLERMDGLVKLSLEGNALRALDLQPFRWTRLEMLNVSGNRLERVDGLAGLQALVALNVDDNLLGTLDAGGTMPRLRILRASGNRLRALQVHWFAGLRTLYADTNALEGEALLAVAPASTAKTVGRAAGKAASGSSALGKLENLSLRNQACGRAQGLRLDFEDVRDAKRLYLSGNALPANFLSAACYNLVYLELANCRLATLPPGLATLTPNLRALNLNYNFLEDVRGLEGLARLRKLSVVGARLKGTKEIIRVVRGLPEVEVLDFRMNPCTLGWYLPLIVQGEGELSAGRWAELDGRFRRGLPDAVYVGRLAYRGLVMGACGGVRVLDGVCVTEKERAKTVGVLARLAGK
ncbi:hypothetical protein DFH08DRAFT_834757 [Mycena albidolilacea]|uniref:L domain-like protein n=1 Tax=Mycena albidolilacea TaxID=1033008 RepID=A0AAD7F2N0_9AGAR|nr:hypothetical protein DFH08DRAFT_834757 [Mycena albidolilacea]